MPREDLYVGDHAVRLRRRNLLIAAAVAATLLAGAGLWALFTSSGPGGEAGTEAATTRPAAPRETTIAEDAAVIAEAIRTAQGAWRAQVTDVAVMTTLRRPVVVVQTVLTGEEAYAAESLSAEVSLLAGALGTPSGMPRTYYIQIRSQEGEVIGALAFTDARWSLDAPPAPADAVSLSAWLEQVYGSPKEPWLSAVRSISGPEGGPSGTLVVETDLDPARAEDLATAQTIFDAINSSGARFAQSIRLTFADPTFEWTVVMDGIDPYGP